jgi:hypothetical protein
MDQMGMASLARGLLLVCVVAGLSACVDTAQQTPRVEASLAVASAGGASVAFASIEGAPEAVSARLANALAEAASSHDIAVSDVKRAKYLVRGYVTAYPVEGGTAFAYVWDVFGADKKRAQRVDDALVVKGTVTDPWSLADDQVLASLAAHSTNDIAGFLAGLPAPASAKFAPDEDVRSPNVTASSSVAQTPATATTNTPTRVGLAPGQ